MSPRSALILLAVMLLAVAGWFSGVGRGEKAMGHTPSSAMVKSGVTIVQSSRSVERKHSLLAHHQHHRKQQQGKRKAPQPHHSTTACAPTDNYLSHPMPFMGLVSLNLIMNQGTVSADLDKPCPPPKA